MSRILLTWELGDNLGHVGCFVALAQALLRRGHEPVLCLRDLVKAVSLMRGPGFHLLQAPLWQGEGRPEPPLNYGDMLRSYGFTDALGLGCMVNAWRNLFTLIAPQLMIFDHAPTALLASSGMRTPRAVIGTGFFTPPRTMPFPPMRWWQPHSLAQLAAGDASVLATANQALERNGLSPLRQLHELFAVDENFLCSYEEFDHYPQRTGPVRYWGASYVASTGCEPDWPIADGPRVFAYLDKKFCELEKTLRILASYPARVLIYSPGIDPKLAARLKSARLTFATEPVDLARLGAQCDVGVCHANHDVASALLLAGIPLLLLPGHLEQYLLAMNIQKLGAGLLVLPEATPKDYADALRRLLTEPAFRQSTHAFSTKYADENPRKRVDQIADRCEELIAQTKSTSGKGCAIA